MEINRDLEAKLRVSWYNYIDIRNNKLVLVARRITEGYYNTTEVVDKVVGSVLDIIV